MCLRLILWLIVLLNCGVAAAAIPADMLEPIKKCFEAEPLASLKSGTRVGRDNKAAVYYLEGANDSYLVFTEPGCQTFRMSTVSNRAAARWLSGSQQTTALALPPQTENGPGSPSALVVRGTTALPLGALRLETHCDMALRIRPLRLFPDQDSLEVFCQSEAAAGYQEHRILVHAFDGQLILLHDAYMGTYMGLATDEKRAGACALHPGGYIKVLRAGPRPVLQIPEMMDDSIIQRPSISEYKPGIAHAYEWSFDPLARRFVKSAQSSNVRFDAYRGCRPRR